MLRVILFFVHGYGVDEIAMPTLQESYNLSASMYAVPTLTLSSNQTYKLNVCWNSSVVRRLFACNKWASVKAVLMGLARLNIKHLIIIRQNFLQAFIFVFA